MKIMFEKNWVETVFGSSIQIINFNHRLLIPQFLVPTKKLRKVIEKHSNKKKTYVNWPAENCQSKNQLNDSSSTVL